MAEKSFKKVLLTMPSSMFFELKKRVSKKGKIRSVQAAIRYAILIGMNDTKTWGTSACICTYSLPLLKNEISSYVDGKSVVSKKDLIDFLCKNEDQKNYLYRQIASIMNELGYETRQVRINGTRQYVWRKITPLNTKGK